MLNATASALLAATMTLTLPSGSTISPSITPRPTPFATSTNTLHLDGIPPTTESTFSHAEDPIKAIQRAKQDDPISFNEKVNKLKSSPALLDLFEGAPNQETVDTYIDFFALVSTTQQIDHFITTTKGKHFVFVGEGSNTEAVLVEGEPSQTYSCCRCWQARAASIGYFAASQLTCIPIGLLGGAISGGVGIASGFICSGIFYAIESLPNFDAACPRR